ncbi:unnamed protein product [Porites lobata]|uniref:NUDE domain-containing protein n=1 Tax=Porites lobata TaxID=104759 RepID=A0ABN8N8X3_9CNID|nr:unnamed protein product [Porites lobata]
MRQPGMSISTGDKELEFADPKEEAKYWKQFAEDLERKLQEARDELDEFQEGSRELEAELEMQLEQAEARQRELLAAKTRLETENENLKARLDASQNESYLTISSLQDEVAQLKAVREEVQKYVRELEQANDDLERAKRATVCSLEDFEQKLNQAIERNAILENELDEKETLQESVQRLKDEARDLRQELAVKEKERRRPSESMDLGKDKGRNKENKEPLKTEGTPTKPETTGQTTDHITNLSTTSIGTSPLHTGYGSSPLTPSARISALNIVGDLLRKVGALESKLASCRNFVKDQPRNPRGSTGSNSPADSPRPSRIPKSNYQSPGMQGLVKVQV